MAVVFLSSCGKAEVDASSADDPIAAPVVVETSLPEVVATKVDGHREVLQKTYPKTQGEIVDDLRATIALHDEHSSPDLAVECLLSVSTFDGSTREEAYDRCDQLPEDCPGECEVYVAASEMLLDLALAVEDAPSDPSSLAE